MLRSGARPEPVLVRQSRRGGARLYGLTVDRRERDALDSDALRLYDDNGNDRITCAEAHAHGIAHVYRCLACLRVHARRDGGSVLCE